MPYPKYNIYPNFRITANGNYQVLITPGAFHLITVVAPGTSWSALIYDGLDATGKLLANPTFSSSVPNLVFDIELQKGLFFVLTGTAGEISISAG